jgi:sensor histidine kinase YesM
MEQYPFIFSDKLKYRVRRHLAFWLFWGVFQGFLYSFIWIDLSRGYLHYLGEAMIESMIYLTAHIFLSYTLIYFVVPRYLLKQRYWATAIWVISLFLITAGISTTLWLTAIRWLRQAMLGVGGTRNHITTITAIGLSLLGGLRGGITIGGIAATIKLMKYWYTNERKNLQLQKEKAEAQLQLLKAQVHPHFLFNTLNNIYAYTQNTSVVASTLVMGLSDMLRYMLYECSVPLVGLDKELKMLRDYSLLEQIRYGNRLELHMDLPGHVQDLYIAPLLLLPFVENCFKHGTSNILEQPWISLHISIEGNTLKMNLVNGKPPSQGKPLYEKAGIGIVNVRKRLSLLYPDVHTLHITEEEEVFIVNLTLTLERKETAPVQSVPRTAREIYV